MWFANDALHYVWKKVSGDLTITADLSFLGTGGDAHRKAILMMRQTLDADSAYADAALHGDGLTSLQTRAAKGEATHEMPEDEFNNVNPHLSPDGQKLAFLSYSKELKEIPEDKEVAIRMLTLADGKVKCSR